VVYVKYRDAAGNVSSVYSDDIRVKTAGSLGAIHGRFLLKTPLFQALLDPQVGALTVKPGAAITILNDSLYGPAFTTLTGDGTLSDLLPGIYDLKIEYPGYIPLVLKHVAVTSGATTELGDQTLTPLSYIHLPRVNR
jgi:hypothetical protein